LKVGQIRWFAFNPFVIEPTIVLLMNESVNPDETTIVWQVPVKFPYIQGWVSNPCTIGAEIIEAELQIMMQGNA